MTYQPFLAQPVDITLPPSPANDDFDNATVITATDLPFSAATLDTRGATTAADDPDDPPGGSASGYPYASVWYAFTPTENMSVTISTAGSDYDASVKVFTGVRGALTRATCSPEFAFRALAHTTYYFMIHDSSGLDGIGGTLVFALNDLRTNDDFDHATVIAGLPFSITLDTREATTAADDPTSCSGNPRATVWYSFTPAEETWLTASTAGSDFYSLLAVFTGARGALSLVACGAGNTAFRAVARTTYYFMISSCCGSDLPGGTLVFALHGIPALHIGPTISGTGSFDPQTGVAKISGTVDCSAAAAVSFFNGLLQRPVGQFVISGPIPDFTVANCSGTIPWSATVNPTNGKFRGGPATATLSWSAYDLGGTGQYVTGTATTKIHLKGGH